MARKDLRLTGVNPLSYIGVNAYSPPNIQEYERAPIATDIRNFVIGDMWIDRSTTPKNLYVLAAKDGGVAEWITGSTSITLPLVVSDGGTGLTSITDHSLVVGSGTAAMTELGVAGNGVLPIGSVGADPVLATITAGPGISVTNGAGSITVSTGPGGLVWSEITGTTQAMAVNNGYLANNAAPVVLTLPATAALFSAVEVVGKGAGGFKIAQNAGQTVIWEETLSTTPGVGGYLESTDDYDKVKLMCTVANTTWTAVGSKGNITIV